MSAEEWSETARQRGLVGLLVASLLLVVLLVRPFLDALLFAAATAAVTWPVYERVLRWTGGRRRVAAGLTAIGLLVLLGVPLGLLAVWFVQDTAALVQRTIELVQQGALRAQIERLAAWVRELPYADRLGPDVDLVTLVAEPLQRAVLGAGQAIAGALPDVVGGLASALLDVIVYLFAVLTLYADGPALLRAATRLSPLRPEYHERLFDVFREFSRNLVVGSIVTSTLQGLVAAIGYWFAGVPNLVLASLLTGVFAFVPVFGTALVWVPIAIWLGAQGETGWAVFLVAWNMGLTGMVDNLLRPFLLRGRSPIHPLPIFVAVIGGIVWLGLPGALVGAVAVAMFLALYQIWCEEADGVPARALYSSPAPSPSPASAASVSADGGTPSPSSKSSSAA